MTGENDRPESRPEDNGVSSRSRGAMPSLYLGFLQGDTNLHLLRGGGSNFGAAVVQRALNRSGGKSRQKV